ncbi:dethiobiotin synthase [Ningiella sp. W23]|uniref:dethiobiotin synthase n=1 Tax=Ningiella sp. W23 TaxID=3023715 RepID=UPI003756BCA3
MTTNIANNQSFFVTGTDTDVGKTFVSTLLLSSLNEMGYSTLGFKPISAGCERTQEGLRNEDALLLKAASSVEADYDHVNPIAFEPPIAPHIAAQEQDVIINLLDLQLHFEKIKEYGAQRTLIEGAGGWRLPINDKQYLSDFAIQNQLPVVLVVGMRLGCLNHAMLSYQALVSDQLNCVGWIANQLSADMPYYEQNKATLQRALGAPLLAQVPFAESADKAVLEKTECFDEVFRCL